MIQPISTLTPRVGFRGSSSPYGMRAKGFSDSGAAMISALGLSIASGGITAAIARVYTKSWSQAGMLGLFGTFLTLFFMAPRLIENFGLKKTAAIASENVAMKKEAVKMAEVAKQVKPAMRLVPFRSDTEINP